MICTTATRARGVMFPLAFAFISAASYAAELPVRVYSCRNAPVAPRVDGVLDDAAWKAAPTTQGFTYIGPRGGARDTRFRAVRDDAAVYFAIECLDPDARNLTACVTQRDGRVYDDDSVELFLDVSFDRATYVQLAYNSLAVQFDGQGLDPSWNADWQVKARVVKDRWIAEVRMPFASLGATRPTRATLWGVNVCRNCQTSSGAVFSAWSASPSGFHSPKRFGLLTFGSLAENLRAHCQTHAHQREQLGAELRKALDPSKWPEGIRSGHEQAGRKWAALADKIANTKQLSPQQWATLRQTIAAASKSMENLVWDAKYEALFAP